MKKLLLYLLLFLLLTSFKNEAHPFHVGSVEFNFNRKSQTFEISEKFFIDDLENAINKNNKKSVRFLDAKLKNEMNEALKNYTLKNLKLKADGKILKINYLGYQEENESVNIFLESEKLANPTKVETAISMLYNIYDDQMNIIHIVVDGKRKSKKLTFPDQYFKNQF